MHLNADPQIQLDYRAIYIMQNTYTNTRFHPNENYEAGFRDRNWFSRKIFLVT